MSGAGSGIGRRLATIAAAVGLVVAMGGTWTTGRAAAAPGGTAPSTSGAPATGGTPTDGSRSPKKTALVGKLNLNTATEEQLMMLPTVGPSKAERIVVWRKKNGGFKRIADLRRVKGFGYRTFKRLEPWLDVRGESTLAAR